MAGGVRDENRVVGNFGLPEGLHPFPENADDRKRYAESFSFHAYGIALIAGKPFGQALRHYRNFGARHGVFRIEEPSSEDVKISYRGVSRIDAKYQRIAFSAAAHHDAIVQLHHGRSRLDARDLLLHRAHII